MPEREGSVAINRTNSTKPERSALEIISYNYSNYPCRRFFQFLFSKFITK